jgi:hypothetical protein
MHMQSCAIHDDGPCTCGTEEILEELALEEAMPLHEMAEE